MGKTPRKHSPTFKATVALDLMREYETLAQVCTKYNIHPTQARRWKDQAMTGLTATFTDRPAPDANDQRHYIDELYKKIGQLNIQLDWLKKKTGLDPDA